MFEMNYFIYVIFTRSDLVLLNFVSADSHITSDRHQKFVTFTSTHLEQLSAKIYFVSVLISTNHNARYLYPEINVYLPDWLSEVDCISTSWMSELPVQSVAVTFYSW